MKGSFNRIPGEEPPQLLCRPQVESKAASPACALLSHKSLALRTPLSLALCCCYLKLLIILPLNLHFVNEAVVPEIWSAPCQPMGVWCSVPQEQNPDGPQFMDAQT